MMNVPGITLIGAISNVLLAALKVTLGIVAGSRALVADGIHSLADLVTDVAVLVGSHAAGRPPDEDHAFGHGRYETLSALFIGFSLAIAGIGVGYDAIRALGEAMQGSLPSRPGIVAAAAALLSILVKEALYHATRRVGFATGSPAVIANAWHHRSDAFSSLAALFGIVTASLLGPEWRIMDSIAALIVAVLVVIVGGQTVWTALREMTDVGLASEECRTILSDVAAIEGVSDPHGLKTRRLGTTVAVEIHVRVDGAISVDEGHEIATRVENRIKQRFGDETRVIAHVEPIIRSDLPR